MKKTIGYTKNGYPEKRNIINKVNGYKYKKVYSYSRLKYLSLRLLQKSKLRRAHDNKIQYLVNEFFDFNLNSVTLMHFFNQVSYGSTPWITTFETFVPRYPELMNHQIKGIPTENSSIKKALKTLSSENCKKIIAISECTKNFQLELLNFYPEFKEEIASKLTVIHPPQEVLVDLDNYQTTSNTVSFMFIGRLFFRKGGLETLKAFIKFKEKLNYDIKLTIVSTLGAGDDATLAGENDVALAKKLINKYSWIDYYKELPNDEVLSLMKEHDIGLLPTWADTYGYSILEFQASGCPVITTDVRAIPEINNEKTGWIINVPKNKLGEAKYSNECERKILSQTIEEQLYSILISIFENKDGIKLKRRNSIKRIIDHHSPVKYANKLEEIYNEALV